MRLKSSIWVSAHIRRCELAGSFALIERKGAEEAGAIIIRVDVPDKTSKLFMPAPQAVYESGSAERKWQAYKGGASLTADDARKAIASEVRMDPDVWVLGIEDVEGRSFLPEDLLV
jgi:hypothetical protein